MLENKWYHVKVLPHRFHLIGHITGFCAQAQKLEQLYQTPSLPLAVPSGERQFLWSNAVVQPRLQPWMWQTESVEGVLRYLPCLIWCSAFGYLLDRQFNHCDVFKFHRFCKLWECRFSSSCYSGYAWISDWHEETQGTTQEAQGCKQTLLTFVHDR